MKKLSTTKMVDTITTKRKDKNLSQAPAEALDFEVVDLFEEEKKTANAAVLNKNYNIAVAGTGYVGLSIAILLAQHNHVTAVDIIPEKVELINNKKSPIQDDYI